jgi:aspartyl-tRNA(Asn)/glutamyl-tRNA(Gln) amidotransferase subunit A
LRARKRLDPLLVPSTAIGAPILEQDTIDIDGKNIEVYVALSRLRTVFDITGLPAFNVPAGFIDGHLPIDVQLVGRKFDEGRLLSLAHIYEEFQDF